MYRCYCPEYCLSNGGNDSDGRPLGLPFHSEYLLQTHMIRIQCEHCDQEVLLAQTAQQAEAVGTQLFATTLFDDPSIFNLTTHSSGAPPDSASSDDGSIQAIIAGVQCIGLSPEASFTSVEEEFCRLSLDTPCSDISSPTSSPISQSSASDQQSNQASSKAERSQHTKTALAQLSHIESGILSSANELVCIPSPEKISEIKQLVNAWHKALASINQSIPVVKTRKTVVVEVLHRLKARLSEVTIISPSDPVQYNMGKFFALTARTKSL